MPVMDARAKLPRPTSAEKPHATALPEPKQQQKTMRTITRAKILLRGNPADATPKIFHGKFTYPEDDVIREGGVIPPQRATSPPSGPLKSAPIFPALSTSSIFGSSHNPMRGFGSKLKFAKNQLKTLFTAPPPAPAPAVLEDAEEDPVRSNSSPGNFSFFLQPPPSALTRASSAASVPLSPMSRRHQPLRTMLKSVGYAGDFDDEEPKGPARRRYIEDGELEQAEADAKARELTGEAIPYTCYAMSSVAGVSRWNHLQRAWTEESRDVPTTEQLQNEDQWNRLAAHQKAQNCTDQGRTLLEAGNWKDAVGILDDALAFFNKAHEEGSEASLLAMACLGVAFELAERHEDAKSLKKKVLAVCLRKYGRRHKETLSARANLAATYSDLKRHDKALREHQAVLEVRREDHGVKDEATLLSMHNVGREQCLTRDYVEGNNTLSECLECRSALLGPTHVDTVVTKHWLGKVLFAMQRFTEAGSLFQECVAACTLNLGADHPGTHAVGHHLAKCKLAIEWADSAPQPGTPPSTPMMRDEECKVPTEEREGLGRRLGRMSSSSLASYLRPNGVLKKQVQEELDEITRKSHPLAVLEMKTVIAEHEQQRKELKEQHAAERRRNEDVLKLDADARELKEEEERMRKLETKMAVREEEVRLKVRDPNLAPEDKEAMLKKHCEDMKRLEEGDFAKLKNKIDDLKNKIKARRERRKKEWEKRQNKEAAELKRRQQVELDLLKDKVQQEERANKLVYITKLVADGKDSEALALLKRQHAEEMEELCSAHPFGAEEEPLERKEIMARHEEERRSLAEELNTEQRQVEEKIEQDRGERMKRLEERKTASKRDMEHKLESENFSAEEQREIIRQHTEQVQAMETEEVERIKSKIDALKAKSRARREARKQEVERKQEEELAKDKEMKELKERQKAEAEAIEKLHEQIAEEKRKLEREMQRVKLEQERMREEMAEKEAAERKRLEEIMQKSTQVLELELHKEHEEKRKALEKKKEELKKEMEAEMQEVDSEQRDILIEKHVSSMKKLEAQELFKRSSMDDELQAKLKARREKAREREEKMKERGSRKMLLPQLPPQSTRAEINFDREI